MTSCTVLVLAACGSESDTSPSGSAGDGSFPVTVAHLYGKTTVPAKPKRIVIVGLTEQDTVLQLGYTPVGVTEWYGNQPQATWPWAREALGDAKPTVLKTTDGFQFERIAALRPDLIIGVNAGLERSDYRKLSKLAPTVAAPADSAKTFSPWDDQVRLIAAALGKRDEGEQLVKDTEDAYAAVAEKHPEFRGRTASFAQNAFYNGLLYAYQNGLNTEFLTMLGFTINPKLDGLIKTAGEQVAISEERLDVLDADVIVFATEEPADVGKLEKVPTFGELDAIKRNRAVFTDGTLAGAMYFMTPLSMRYTLDRLTPQLADAASGKAPRRVVDTAD